MFGSPCSSLAVLVASSLLPAGAVGSPTSLRLGDERPRELVETAAGMLAAVGYRIDLEQVTVESEEPERYRKDLRSQSDLFFGPDHFRHMAIFLHALGAHPARTEESLVESFLQGFGQVALAYYQPDRDTFVVLDNPTLLGQIASADPRPVYVHELVHAAQDQARRFSGFERLQGSIDQVRAYHALLEGEAELATQLAFGIDPAQSSEAVDELQSVLAGPLALVYSSGRRFLATVYAESGLDAVRALYDTPPTSTEQVMHPEKFRIDLPSTPRFPGLPYSVAKEMELGELQIRTLLEGMGLSPPTAALAATGWDGDRVRIYETEGKDPLVLWHSVWDREQDAQQFVDALAQVGVRTAAAFGRSVVWRGGGASREVERVLERAFDSFDFSVPATATDATSTAAAEEALLARQRARRTKQEDRWVRENLGLSLPIPNGWALRDVGPTTVLAFGQPIDGFLTNVNVQALPSGGLDMAAIEALNRQQLQALPGIELLSMEQVQRGGHVVLRYEMSGDFGQQKPLHGIGTIALVGEMQVVVTVMSTQDRWKEVGESCAAVVDGLRFLDRD